MTIAGVTIIGCGNRDRGDDQAGLVAAERLRLCGLDAEIHTGDALSLIERWGPDDDVILIDAVVSGASPGRVCVWDSALPGAELPTAAAGSAVSSHGFDIAKAIELARALGKLPRRLRIFGIEAAHFDRGANMSPEVESAIDRVVEEIKEAIASE